MNWPDLDLEDIKDLGLDWPEGDILQGGLGGMVLPQHQHPGGMSSNTSTPTHSAMNTAQNNSINNASPMLNTSEGLLGNNGYQVCFLFFIVVFTSCMGYFNSLNLVFCMNTYS